TTGADTFQTISRIARDFKQPLSTGLSDGKTCYTIMSAEGSKTEKSIIEKLGKSFNNKKINLKAESITNKVAEGYIENYRNTLK
ncbi:MAG: hypothetical protein WCF95_06660, partial [bacterium]